MKKKKKKKKVKDWLFYISLFTLEKTEEIKNLNFQNKKKGNKQPSVE